MASPNKFATLNVVKFTPPIGGRETVSVVISSSMTEFRNLSMPMGLNTACETHA